MEEIGGSGRFGFSSVSSACHAGIGLMWPQWAKAWSDRYSDLIHCFAQMQPIQVFRAPEERKMHVAWSLLLRLMLIRLDRPLSTFIRKPTAGGHNTAECVV